MQSSSPPDAAAIARHFLPSRWHYYYARSKLGSDPLYEGVARALRGSSAPLLDLGCGIGLLLHALAARGLKFVFVGVDNDSAKVELAREAAVRAGLDARFLCMDLAAEFPRHEGSVAVLDMLQFLPPPRVEPFLHQAAGCIAGSGRLVIRTGLHDASWRAGITRTADVFARAIRWMNAAPREYPTRALLTARLERLGLTVQFEPLWGGTPFNNWLIIAERRAHVREL